MANRKLPWNAELFAWAVNDGFIEAYTSPWKRKVKTKINDENANIGKFKKEDIEKWVNNLAPSIAKDLGLDDYSIILDFGQDKDVRFTHGIKTAMGYYSRGKQEIHLVADTIYESTKNSNFLVTKKAFEKEIESTLSHEFRHRWQHTKQKDYYSKAYEEYTNSDSYKKLEKNPKNSRKLWKNDPQEKDAVEYQNNKQKQKQFYKETKQRLKNDAQIMKMNSEGKNRTRRVSNKKQKEKIEEPIFNKSNYPFKRGIGTYRIKDKSIPTEWNTIDLDVSSSPFEEADFETKNNKSINKSSVNNDIKSFDSDGMGQVLYNDYINKLEPIKSIDTAYGTFDVKHSKRGLMFDNAATSMAAVYPGTNGSVVAVDDSFFNLKPKTQDFILGHEIGHMVTGITSDESDFLTQTLETKVDISSGYSYDDIIESLEDIKANISPEYHKAFNTRIQNIKNYINKNIKPTDILPSDQIQNPSKWFQSTSEPKTQSSTKKTYTTSKDKKKNNKQKKQSKNQGKKQVVKKKSKVTGNAKKDIANAVINEVINEAIETTVETATDTVEEAVEKIVDPVSRFGKTNNYGIPHEQVAQYAKDNFLSIDEAYERLDKLNEIESSVDGKILPTDYGKNRTGYTVNQLGGQDAEGNFTYFNEKGNLVKSGMLDSNIINEDGSVITKVKKDTRPDGNIRKDDIKKPSKFWNQADDTIFSKGMRGFNVAANVVGTIATYKNARRQGHGVVSSAARAGVDFAIGEALGMWAIPLELVKNVPTAVIKGTEALYKENRKMNAAANNQAFSNAQFSDNQQLATMRQSGMEMARMSQYNLQQTLMGNEASMLHR